MSVFHSFLISIFFLVFSSPSAISESSELSILMAIKASLDPQNTLLTSWSPSSNPCGGYFEGVACNEQGKVVNISLQGMGLSGYIPAAVAGLKSLTGLYLHFNALIGEIPKEIASLTELTDLYLNVNQLSGEIPFEIGNMVNLQVLQLCYNKLTGGIPSQVGNMKVLNVLAVQYNQLTGAIPASLGNLTALTRLDLSNNKFFGPIPVILADAPALEVLNVQNNSLTGNVPPGFRRLKEKFVYDNNPSLCGVGFRDLNPCSKLKSLNPSRPEPFLPQLPTNLSARDIPESANLRHDCNGSNCLRQSKSSRVGVALGVIGVFAAFSAIGLATFSWYRRNEHKFGSSSNGISRRMITSQVREVYRRNASPLINLEYSNGWDPLAKDHGGSASSREVFKSFMFNLEDVERATQCFSKANLLGRNNFSALYKGKLRDGSVVAIKCIGKTSCKSDEAEFLKGLKILISMNHENLVKFRGLCCSKDRGECYLIYDFVTNGTLMQYLDDNNGSGKILDWSTRVSIICGIAKGIGYLHRKIGKKPALIHQNISADKVLIDANYNPLLSDSGLHKLLADDIIFSMLKVSAALGYLPPEYTTTGRFTEKSDVYAFGMIVLQIISGKTSIVKLNYNTIESRRFEDFIDSKLEGRFLESEADKLGKIAVICTHEYPELRPTMDVIVQELDEMGTFGISVESMP
ncbi:Leucine-rich repeat receptor protein kinase EMS1 [Cucurbita argyrosperma subsp. argyrosperma]|uniref:Probable LRR receptor-like serine/threonine-protein kinase At1g34110 n=1 Tax=Cucurbita moschata TaxID=3662 RepID=A0A6J1EFF0_CUCMO|nr:probable LRR receptor-like serine/threonine-protein kinase At1g34110 [Cucurbita moschata]KAG7018939.1 Leucine-rich repeat receptor protein kinase EMS1 [Cucurbita argyrosperma subsp. argyrosperma]